jgi:hypothetical protein
LLNTDSLPVGVVLEESSIMKRVVLLSGILGFTLYSMVLLAAPINITGQLTGDIRDDNPDGLIVDVTITGDTNSDLTYWTVDINSPLHPDIKLDEFYFNLALTDISSSGIAVGEEIVFLDFDPIGWAIQTPANVQGAGGTTFLFETLDPPGPPNANDVTNTQNLAFTAKLLTGNWSIDNFLTADVAVSNDAGQGQLGAHLQSLTLNNPGDPATSDSGFAFGGYNGEVPEPGTIALIGTGLLGMGLIRRRRKMK